MKITRNVILIILFILVIITVFLLLFLKVHKPISETYPSVRHFNALPNSQQETINRSLDAFWRA